MARGAATVAVAAAVGGCASVPMGDPQEDRALKTFAVAPDRAGIFVYRNELAGAAVRMDVRLDGVPLGQTAARTYLYREVAPGRHRVVSIAENTATLDLDVEAGTQAFVWQEVTFGAFSARSRLQRVDEAQGRQGVQQSSLVLTLAPTQAIEVRVDAADPAWAAPLQCTAANGFGSWAFVAPGTVTVASSVTPLQIACTLPGDGVAGPQATVPVAGKTAHDTVRQGTGTGAAVGAVAGVAMGIAAAPVMGPAFAALLAMGTTLSGAQVGALAGALTADGGLAGYPSPIVLRIAPAPATK